MPASRNVLSVLWLSFVLGSPMLLPAQYKVQFVLDEQTSISHNNIYVSGSFNNWDSTENPRYRLQQLSGSQKAITIQLKAGVLRYKFHRGSWQRVEKRFFGWEVPDRVVNISKDTVLTDSVAAWSDELLMDKWHALKKEQSDTTYVYLLSSLAEIYGFNSDYYNVDSALSYSRQALVHLQSVRTKTGQNGKAGKRYAHFLLNLQKQAAELMHSLGNYSKALDLRLDNLRMAQKEKFTDHALFTISGIVADYIAMKDFENALKYANLVQSLTTATNQLPQQSVTFSRMTAYIDKAVAYYNLQHMDSSFHYASLSKRLSESNLFLPGIAASDQLLGDFYTAKNEFSKAIGYYRMAIDNALKSYQAPVFSRSQQGMARVYQRLHKRDSALFYAKAALTSLQNKAWMQVWGENTDMYVAELSPLLAELYFENDQPDSAYKYLQLSVAMKDSLYNLDRVRQFQNISFNEAVKRQQQQQDMEIAQQQFQNRMRVYLLVAGLLITLAIAYLLYRNNKQKQRTNEVLQCQKEKSEKQKAKVEQALEQLKATQAQLIQKEKMASLGELTAGIAHEIQNPLNFINNFSEVNAELTEELKQEALHGSTPVVLRIADEIRENEQKILHHGKRADAIVKNMLQHSRQSAGEKVPTDINALADEYLRLSYHGLRSKDKTFNAAFETHFDEKIGKITVVPQEIGRVLLNLFNNAFYAVNEKKKELKETFEPLVTVRTSKEGQNIRISVRDNGNGIPQTVQDKIFQPFFTTKPSGVGTGLGLSLSYDIITKGHGGSLKVDTMVGEYAGFVIQLPATTQAVEG